MLVNMGGCFVGNNVVHHELAERREEVSLLVDFLNALVIGGFFGDRKIN